jgi:hypothetical protein
MTASSSCRTATMFVPVRIRAELESELVRFGPRGELSFGDGLACGLAQQVSPLLLIGGDAIVDAALTPAELRRRAHEEAAARKHPALDVVEESVAECEEPIPAGRGRTDRGLHHFPEEALPRRVDRRELQLLLGAEQDVHAALRHAGGFSQAADREAVEALSSRLLSGCASCWRRCAAACRSP